jgi:hypothetical protein
MIERFAIHFALGRRLREPPGRPRAGPRRGCLFRGTEWATQQPLLGIVLVLVAPVTRDEFLGLGDPVRRRRSVVGRPAYEMAYRSIDGQPESIHA